MPEDPLLFTHLELISGWLWVLYWGKRLKLQKLLKGRMLILLSPWLGLSSSGCSGLPSMQASSQKMDCSVLSLSRTPSSHLQGAVLPLLSAVPSWDKNSVWRIYWMQPWLEELQLELRAESFKTLVFHYLLDFWLAQFQRRASTNSPKFLMISLESMILAGFTISMEFLDSSEG